MVGVGLYIGEEHRRRLRIDRKVILESKSRPTCHVAGENSMNFMICSLPHIGIIKERRGWADPIARTRDDKWTQISVEEREGKYNFNTKA